MTRFTIVVAALSVQSALAFAPPASTTATKSSATAVGLVPEQGRQLVAFSQDYLSHKAKESASRASNLSHRPSRRTGNDRRPAGVLGSVGRLVTRLRGDEIGSHPQLEEEVHREDGGVMYPIVGFNLVDGHAVPTPGQTAACSLHQEAVDEQVVGYWSPHGGDSLWV